MKAKAKSTWKAQKTCFPVAFCFCFLPQTSHLCSPACERGGVSCCPLFPLLFFTTLQKMDPHHGRTQSAIPPLFTSRPPLPQPNVQQQSTQQQSQQQHPPSFTQLNTLTHNQHPSQHFSPHQQQHHASLNQPQFNPFTPSPYSSHTYNQQQQYNDHIHRQQHNSYRVPSQCTSDRGFIPDERHSSPMQSHFSADVPKPPSQSSDIDGGPFLISPASTPLLSSLVATTTTDTATTSMNTLKNSLSEQPATQDPTTPASSNSKPTTKRGLPASATLPKAKKKRIIAEEDDDDNDIEEEPS